MLIVHAVAVLDCSMGGVQANGFYSLEDVLINYACNGFMFRLVFKHDHMQVCREVAQRQTWRVCRLPSAS